MQEVLIVEDDLRLAEAVKQILESSENYHADIAIDGKSGVNWALNNEYDVILLDVMLPEMNGIDVVKTLRQKGNSTPVIMLTAKVQIPDRVEGLDSGADDYMTKPFSPAELMARIRAVTRGQDEEQNENDGKYVFEGLELDLESHELSSDGTSVNLPYKEFLIVRKLMEEPGKLISKDEIVAEVWGEKDEADNNIEAYMSFLRKKLRFIHTDVQIETIRKLGYRLIKG